MYYFLLGLLRFCSEKAKKLLKIEKVAKKFCKDARIFLRQYMSNFNSNCFVINIKVQLSNYLQQIRQSLVESKWLVSRLSRGGLPPREGKSPGNE